MKKDVTNFVLSFRLATFATGKPNLWLGKERRTFGVTSQKNSWANNFLNEEHKREIGEVEMNTEFKKISLERWAYITKLKVKGQRILCILWELGCGER